MTYAMTRTEVLEERPQMSRLLEEARMAALEAAAELPEPGKLDSESGDARMTPEYWLGRLEGAIVCLVAAVDMELGGE